MFSATIILLFIRVTQVSSNQHLFPEDVHKGWSINISSNWRVLGPFSQHAREQHFTSPSYPINLSNRKPVDFGKTYQSSLANGASIHWTNITSDGGHIKLEFPNIRWEELRLSEGWAGLQHHALLYSELVITPPSRRDDATLKAPLLQATVQQISFFTIALETPSPDFIPTWYSGNIYDLPNAPTHLIELPSAPSRDGPTKYHIFASGDYEIRLFGDPLETEGQINPIQRLKFDLLAIQPPASVVHLEPQLDIVPDFVDGWALAPDGYIGIGLKNTGQGWWEVIAANHSTSGDIIQVSSSVINLAPLQSRILPVQLLQTTPFLKGSLNIDLIIKPSHPFVPHGGSFTLSTVIQLSHKPMWRGGVDEDVYKASYLLGNMPLYFMMKPPKSPSPQSPVIIALHGAGVEASNSFWTDAVSRQQHSWIIFPTGRTTWGFDWHGPSTSDTWGCLSALDSILRAREQWNFWSTREAKVILIGHSNGGQGVWYQAERYPDKVIAGKKFAYLKSVPAAAYIKSQAYIPLTQSRGGHFVDAALRGILESALQPDDNDLLLTNLVSVPLMAIHGGNDRNVPTWHSRQLVEGIRSRYENANVEFIEVPHAPHWWDTVFNNRVQAFLDDAVRSVHRKSPLPERFILTVAIPEENGSLHGFEIKQLEIPGRLGRLSVEINDASINVATSNVWELSLEISSQLRGRQLVVDGITLGVFQEGIHTHASKQRGKWKIVPSPTPFRPSGPLNRVLANSNSLVIVIPEGSARSLSAATRIAHNLLSYLRIDTRIVYDRDAARDQKDGTLGCSNFVIIGGDKNEFGRLLMASSPVPIIFVKDGWTLMGRTFNSGGLGLAFLHPHPTCEASLSLIMASTDDEGLERIIRLFPLRTGVAVPDWVITGPASDTMAGGGLLGAGYWDRDWGWSDTQSWMGFN